MKLMARAGEVITCEAGHPIGIFSKDVQEDSDEYPHVIQWEIADPPQLNDDLPLRCRCGAIWCKAVGEHLVIHVEGEWRPKIPLTSGQPNIPIARNS